MDFANFFSGNEFESYKFFGAHITDDGVVFRTFAPNARKISVIGSFSDWEEVPMKHYFDGNYWEVSDCRAKAGDLYKFKIYTSDHNIVDHADPYGFYSQLRPDDASIIYPLDNYKFKDNEWMSHRKGLAFGPMNIYEVHLGSWRKKDDEDENGVYNYEEIADLLIPYLTEMGYNFLEIMPLNEYPADASWGYQSTGYFSPTSRYGTPDQLRYLIDKCHSAGIAVILDFIPVHFAVNGYGLKWYDGTALFEFGKNPYNEWGSVDFDHSKADVRCFLQSAANYWLSEFHFDGLRFDAVGNLIYWHGNKYLGENKPAISFLRTMNSGLKLRHPEALLFAEDSSAWPGVTKPVWSNGLGFDFKWDLGWMHDSIDYFSTSHEYRSKNYHKLTFSMLYNYNENYVLPLSHDEVVHGKATIVQKMSDLYEGKFRQARAFYMYQIVHPGKKLNFMGNEIGQLREWDEKREQDWMLLKYPIHDSFHRFMKDLNHIYLEHMALYAWDNTPTGFSWAECNQESRNIYGIRRYGNGETIFTFFNFSAWPHDYFFHPGCDFTLTPLLSTEWNIYGGAVEVEKEPIMCKGGISLNLPAFSAQMFIWKDGIE